MYTIQNTYEILRIGKVGENEFRTLEFDVRPWLSLYPAGNITAIFRRPDDQSYPVNVVTEGGISRWTVAAVDLAVAGCGEFEIRILNGAIIGKSCRFSCIVEESSTQGAVPPPPVQDWVTTTLQKAVDATDNLLEAADRGDFNGAPGKSAYEYAKEGGFTGTEEEFSAKLAAEITAFASADWNAADGVGGHIRNRTHFVDADGTVHKLDNKFIDAEWMATRTMVDGTVVFPQKNVNLNLGSIVSGFQMKIEAGISYNVYWNGTLYPCTAYVSDGQTHLGNASIYDETAENTGEPFVIFGFGGTANSIYTSDDNLNITLKITERTEGANKLPMAYLPEGAVTSVNGTKPDSGGNVTLAIEDTAKIDVTAAVGQTIVVKEVDSAGKPTAWEAVDCQKKTHGAVVESLLFPETTMYFSEEGYVGDPLPITLGDACRVTWNGYVYDCVAIDASGFAGDAAVGLGNFGLMNLADTGEPFLFVCNDELGIFMSTEGLMAATCKIEKLTVEKIPTMYIPQTSDLVWIECHSTDPTQVNVSVEEVETAIAQGKLPLLKTIHFYEDGGIERITVAALAGYFMDGDCGNTLQFHSAAEGTTVVLTPQVDGSYLVSTGA